MSDFYLCDLCANAEHGTDGFRCPHSDGVKRMMHDHGHKGGRNPYDEPRDVCPMFRKVVDA